MLRTNIPKYGNIFFVGDTFADLRNLPSTRITENDAAIAHGRVSAADGLGGVYIWRPTLTTADDNYDTLAPSDGAVGRWKRIGMAGPAGPQGDGIATVIAPGGSSLVGFSQSLSGASARTVAAKLGERVSLLDFIPASMHANIRARTSTDNISSYFQAALNALPDGSILTAPCGTYRLTSPVLASKSVSLIGDPGREYFDNSWDRGGGTVFEYTGLTGDALTFRPPAVGNNRMKVVLRDFTVRGARVSTPSATAGRGIVLDGLNHPGTAIHVNARSVYVTEARAEGLYLGGAIYGSTFIDCGAYRNGKNGRRIIGGPDGVGECVWINFRAFENGFAGAAGTHERDGVWDTPGAANSIYLGLSSTANAGNAATLQGGSYVGQGWQFESVTGPNGLYLGSDGNGAGVTSCIVQGMLFSADHYTGTFCNITSDANHVQLSGVGFYGSLGTGGKDAIIAGRKAYLSGVTTLHTLVYQITATDAFVEGGVAGQNNACVFVRAKRDADIPNVTGDDTDYTVPFETEIADATSAFNHSSGVFTAVTNVKVRVTATVTFFGTVAAHDRTHLSLICADSEKTIVQRGPNPFVVRDGNGNTPMTISGIFDLAETSTLRLVATVTGGEKVVGIKGAGMTHISIEALA